MRCIHIKSVKIHVIVKKIWKKEPLNRLKTIDLLTLLIKIDNVMNVNSRKLNCLKLAIFCTWTHCFQIIFLSEQVY